MDQPSDKQRSTELALSARERELFRRKRRDPLPPEPIMEPATPAVDDTDLHVCPKCESGLVYPLDWQQADASRWSVSLRCPDCEWRGEGTYGQDAVDRFDQVLDDSTSAILEDLTRLTHANMEDEIERFVDAIDRDLVLPEDF